MLLHVGLNLILILVCNWLLFGRIRRCYALMLFPFNGKNFVTDLREPFNLQKGWLLWAGVGLVGAIIAIALTGVAVSFFSGETPQREVYALFFKFTGR